EANSQVGMPAVRNFREKKLVKDLYELRDQANLATYTYTFAENSGDIKFFCDSVGYGIPYAVQFTNPEKIGFESRGDSGMSTAVIPQADPNGLFTPSSSEGTWVMCKNPSGSDVKPVYIEPKVIVSPFRLDSGGR